MKKIKPGIIAFILILSMQHMQAAIPSKKASLGGIIVDQASKNPIEYASIVLVNTTDTSLLTGTISAADGSFLIENMEIGTYTLKIHFMGYQTKVIEHIAIKSKKEAVDLGAIPLSPASILLDEAEVAATNNYIDFKIDKKVINVGEHLSAEGGAVVDALHNVPSVQVDAGGNVSLRGSSSFTLLIDGRPSVMDASDALNQIPASSVEKIEIITNPSVKYNSDGTSGIINLLMKKQKIPGFSAQASLTLATGDKYSGSILANQRAQKFGSHLGLSYANKRNQTESNDMREVLSGDSSIFQEISSDRDIYRRNYSIEGGISYDANAHNFYALNCEIGQWEFDRGIDSKMVDNNSWEHAERKLQIKESFMLSNKYIKGDLNYLHKFPKEGHQFETSLYGSLLNNDTPNDISQLELSPPAAYLADAAKYVNIISRAKRDHMRFKADYTLPISDIMNLEAGYQNESRMSATNYSYQFRSGINETWTIDSIRSGEMDFSQRVHAFYTSLSAAVKGISVKGGLRTEYVNQDLSLKGSPQRFDDDRFDFFPSLHLSKSFKNEQQISLSYSKRVSRPNEWMLLPTPYSTGRDMVQVGNPELQPDFTNSYELAYSMRTEIIMLSAESYFREVRDVITPAITEREGVFYQTYENLDKELAAGIDLMTNLNIRPWWSMNLSANIYYYQIKGSLSNKLNVSDESFAWNGRFRTTFIVKQKTFLEFMAVYYGPSILPQGKSQDFYYFDFFVRRHFFDRSLSVALRSHNTFNTGIYLADIEGTNFKSHTSFKYEGPTFLLTLSYRLNNFKRNRSNEHLDMNFDSGLDQ